MVVLGDLGCAAMRAGAALWAAATSVAATAGRMEGMSSGCGFGPVCWRGLAVTWQTNRPIRSAVVGGGGAGLHSPPSWLGWAGLLQCVRACGSLSRGGEQFMWAAFGGRGGWAKGFVGFCGGVCGSLGENGVLLGVALLAEGVCGLAGVGGRSAGGSLAGVCGSAGQWGRPVLRGPGLPAMVAAGSGLGREGQGGGASGKV